MRNSHSLSGIWQFQLDPDGALTCDTLVPDREIQVPLPWQAAFPELERYSGYAWYRRDFSLDDKWLGGEVLLRFGAVDYWCQVFVNGQLVGEHEGGYTEFTLPIRHAVRKGSNELTVRVYDAIQSGLDVSRWPQSHSDSEQMNEPPFDAVDVPHGKQEWYLNVGGIWQDVTLMAVPSRYIEHVRIIPNIHSGEASVRVELSKSDAANMDEAVQVTIRSQDREVAQATVQVVPGQNNYELAVAIDSPQLWSLEDPHLYTACIELGTPSGVDEMLVRFGFREITTGNGQLLLNGQPIYLLSVLDQDFYPGTIYTVPSEEYLRDEFRKAKHLGFNNLRCHIKPPDPLYLDIADEMGILVWAEIPSWRTFHGKTTLIPGELDLESTIERRVEQTLVDMVRRDFNHTSLIIWTIVNEDWGTSLPMSAQNREWVSRMYAFCKELDPTRLVTDNSACPAPWGPNIHVRSDLDDFHIYANIPDHASRFEQIMEQFAMRPAWTYSAHGDAQRTRQEPLILSEFGNWGLPSLRALREAYDGKDPLWLELGPWWSGWEGEPGWPAGVEERFRQLGLDAIWGDYEQFAIATQWHQYAALKFEIETIRRQPSISGYVVTELTDAYWEANGLLDFARNPKVYHDLFSQINAPDMIVPQVERYAYWDDDMVRIALHVSHFGPTDWNGASLHWTIGNESEGLTGELQVPDLQRGNTILLDVQHWMLPPVEDAQTMKVHLKLIGDGGHELARNSLDLLVMPARSRQPSHYGPLAVILREDSFSAPTSSVPHGSTAAVRGFEGEPHGVSHGTGPLQESQVSGDEDMSLHQLARAIRRLSYRTSRQLTEDTRVAVTNYPNPRLLDWVREGGDMLFFTRGPSPFFWVDGRGGTYSGDWITSFSWLKPEIHRRLKIDNPLSMPFMHVMPHGTILGLPIENPAFQGDFLAGMVSGWIRHPAIHTVQFRYGKGRVIMTTMEFEQSLHYDPVAIALFNDLLEYVSSDACQPTLRVE